MKTSCASIRAKGVPGERCMNLPLPGMDWCGKHKTTQVRFALASGSGGGGGGGSDAIQHVVAPIKTKREPSKMAPDVAVAILHRAWPRWIARRAGPLLHFREESNNPFDFFTGDLITDITIGNFVSFVDAGKGYVMGIKSALKLLEHATKTGETPTNPFTRAPLSNTFLRRIQRHTPMKSKKKAKAKPVCEVALPLSIAVTDMFRVIEDLGYYTDPSWFMDLTRVDLMRFYIELADIWLHRATLTPQDRMRIAPPAGRVLPVPVSTAIIMQQKALRPLLMKICTSLISTAVNRADRQLGVMYVLGALSLVSSRASTAYPWLTDMFSPGVTRVSNDELQVLHPSVLAYY